MLNEQEQKYWNRYLSDNNIHIDGDTFINATMAGNINIADSQKKAANYRILRNNKQLPVDKNTLL